MSLPRRSESVLGVVGNAASGKDTVAEEIAGMGYRHISTSDLVRSEISQRGLTTSRKLQTSVANEMRAKNGLGYWVDKAMSDFQGTDKIVVSGLYAPAEGRHLIDQYGGIIIGVVASLDPEEDVLVRFQRLRGRGDGARDALSMADFLEAQQRENSGIQPNETNIPGLLKLAQYTIVNSGTYAELQSEVRNVVNMIEEI